MKVRILSVLGCLLLVASLGEAQQKYATIRVLPSQIAVPIGAVVPFTATITGSNKLPVWIATGGTITTRGVYTAGSVPGVYTVTATLPANVRSSASVTVTPAPDTVAPSVPLNLVASLRTQTSFTVTWDSSTDAVGVVSYGVYLNGQLVDVSLGTIAAFSGFICANTYTVTIDAVDAAGNRSGKATLTASTLACDLPVDSIAPTPPTGMVIVAAQTTLTVSWTASSDNVGVAGYGVYVNGVLKQAVAGTSATITGLTCGAGYIVALDAVDQIGNRSAPLTSMTTQTAPCDVPTPPATTLVFTPAADDATVTSYTAELRRITDPVTGTPIAIQLLGRPVTLNGEIATDISALVNPLPAGTYYANVVATNSSGSAQSEPSASFTK